MMKMKIERERGGKTSDASNKIFLEYPPKVLEISV